MITGLVDEHDRLAERHLLEIELQQAADEGNLWFDLVCALITENSDPGLLRRALDTVEQQKSA